MHVPRSLLLLQKSTSTTYSFPYFLYFISSLKKIQLSCTVLKIVFFLEACNNPTEIKQFSSALFPANTQKIPESNKIFPKKRFLGYLLLCEAEKRSSKLLP